MLNQTFKYRIGLNENANINIDIYDENIEINGSIWIRTHLFFYYLKKTDAEFEELFNGTHNL